MVSKYVLPAAVFFASILLLLTFGVTEWNIVEQMKISNTKMIVVPTSDAVAMLSHVKIINSTTIGICHKVYAASSADTADIVVLICGSRAYIYYLR